MRLYMAVLAGLCFMGAGALRYYPPYAAEVTLSFERQATVYLDISTSDGGSGHCTGVIVGPHTVLTARHCANMDGENVEVYFQGNEGRPAKIAWISRLQDVALLTVDVPAKYKPAKLAPRAAVVGEAIQAIGNPYSAKWMVSPGVVGADLMDVEQDPYAQGLVVIDLFSGPGASGGPVFDADGQVLGLVTQFRALQINLGFGALPVGPTIMLMQPVSSFAEQVGLDA